MGQDVGAGDIDIVGFGKGVAEGDVATDMLDIEGGSWIVLVCVSDKGVRVEVWVRTGIVDESVEMSWAGLDLLVSFFDGFVAVEVDLDQLDGVRCI